MSFPLSLKNECGLGCYRLKLVPFHLALTSETPSPLSRHRLTSFFPLPQLGQYYDYTLKATWQAELVGAFASDATVTQQFVCDFNVSDKLTESKTTTEYQSDFFQVADTRTQYTKASVKVTMSYCDMDGNNVYSQSVEIKDRGFSVFTGELK